MKAFCKKCGKVTNFTEKKSCGKAGDHGFCDKTVWQCDECLFSPFIKPEEVK